MVDFRKYLRGPRFTGDFETRSKCELKKAGAYKYSLDPSTQPTCFAFKIHGEPTMYFLDFAAINRPWSDQPESLRRLWTRLIETGFLFTAHNAFFERCIYENILVRRYGWPKIDSRQFRCTAAKAAACALPRALDNAGSAMKLVIQKDRRGYQAMMATCKPTRHWKAYNDAQAKTFAAKFNPKLRITEKTKKILSLGEPPVFLEPEMSPEVFKVLYTYCKIDVRAEEALDDALPDLIPSEQEIWHLNQTLNWRGLRIDIPTVKKIVGIMAEESTKKLKELDSLTMGLVTKPGARKSILDFLALEGIELPDLKAKTVDDKLKSFDLSEDMHRLLEIRKALSMTSTKKYQAFLNRAGDDDRVRDILLYHGASTGRDTGTGIQPHNFPRGLIRIDKNRPYATVENVVECDADTLRLLYGEALSVLFSSILRNMLIPSDGCELFVADFSKIEVACLWWLAGALAGLGVLRTGKNPYRYQDAHNRNVPYEETLDEGDFYQLAKAQILGCGFGMGWEKFRATAWDIYRLKLTEEQSKSAVQSYRRANPEVPQLWKAYEAAAINVVEASNVSAVQSAGWCHFALEKEFLTIKLPSGRKLYYREPQIAWRESEYGPRKTLEFWAVNSKTKKWALERSWGGTITENIVQATARDLMMPAMVRLEKTGYRALLMVHDEGICEKPTGTGNLDEFVKILCKQPQWAPGLPIEAKGWKGPRYRK
jgi:DNA polymerase